MKGIQIDWRTPEEKNSSTSWENSPGGKAFPPDGIIPQEKTTSKRSENSPGETHVQRDWRCYHQENKVDSDLITYTRKGKACRSKRLREKNKLKGLMIC